MLFAALWNFIRRQIVTLLELVGIEWIVFGANLVFNDRETLDRRYIFIRNFISIGSSIIKSIYLLLTEPLINVSIPTLVYFAMMASSIIVYSLIFYFFYLAENLSFASIHPIAGHFGIFYTKENFI